jgi:hypothetical protein
MFDFDVPAELGSNEGRISISEVGSEEGSCCGEFVVNEDKEGLFVVKIRVGIFGIAGDCEG